MSSRCTLSVYLCSGNECEVPIGLYAIWEPLIIENASKRVLKVANFERLDGSPEVVPHVHVHTIQKIAPDKDVVHCLVVTPSCPG